jgi:RNA 2',3'-cyclic 3'-phosphodiesterase
MRAFIAVACPPEAKEKLANAANRFRPLGDLKNVEKENIHLTLRFLGEVPEGKMDDLIETLSSFKRPGGFNVCIKGLGAFPGPGSPRVLWAGAEKGDKELRELHEAVDSAIASLGYEKDARFSSHYTIARVKSLKDRNGFKELLAEYKEEIFGCFHVDSFNLMKSALHRTGPTYGVVKVFRL